MNKSKLFGEDAPLTKLPKTFPTDIEESWTLGLDLGIGSCGQAIIAQDENNKPQFKNLPNFPGKIALLAVRAFDIPETQEKTGVKLKNPHRREKRLMRRTIRRRSRRMWDIRQLFKDHQLLPADYPMDENLWKYPPARGENPIFDKWRDWHSQMTAGENGEVGPWIWRVEGLDKKLDPLSWAATLLHIAKHRGFKSNRKAASSDEEGGKVLKALKANEERMENEEYRTVGEMLQTDPKFADKKRNSAGNYDAVLLRDDQKKEVELLFKTQRNLGNLHAAAEFEAEYTRLFYNQNPLQNPIHLLGDCSFEKGHKRAPRNAYSYELSRALQKLNNLQLATPTIAKVSIRDYLKSQNIYLDSFITNFPNYGTKSNPGRITWQDLRTIFKLPDDFTFLDLPSPQAKGKDKFESQQDLEKQDFLTRSSANGAAKGSYLLKETLGDILWNQFATTQPEQLDHIAFALTFFEEIENEQVEQKFWGVVNQMQDDRVDKKLIDTVRKDLESDKPTLHKFSGTGSMSVEACRKLIPLLRQGMNYPDACTEIYGDHRQNEFNFDDITNPVVRTVVRECLKQVIHLIDEAGKIPGSICVELSRDLGKSVSERNEIKGAIAKRTTRKNANREALKEFLKREPDPDELLRYELWLEQGHTCPYCGENLGCPDEIMTHSHEIDHILPRSRSHDNSYDNKVLVHRKCNQKKANSTPFEFHEIGNNNEQSEGWKKHLAYIGSLKKLRNQKRRNLINTTFAEDEAGFAARHLNNTSYIARLVTYYLQEIYVLAGEKRLEEKGSTRRVFVQPGQLTDLVRKAWGLQNLKKDIHAQRIGDKHHAIDALICALLSEGQRQFITTREQKKRDTAKNALAAKVAFPDISKNYQLMERENDHNHIPRNVKPPWSNFRNDVAQAVENFTVSRRENRKGTGSLHNDTLYSVKTDENGVQSVFTRKSILSMVNGKTKANLTSAQTDNIRGIHDSRNAWLRDSLDKWITAGSPVDEEHLPRDPQGKIIRKVYLDQGKKSGREYPQGFVTGGDQIRLDVYSKMIENKKFYFLVPIYSYHLKNDSPPRKAIVANKEEKIWDQIDDSHTFEFSLWHNSRVEIKKKPSAKKPAGEHFVGLYSNTNRNTGAFILTDPDDSKTNMQFTAKTGTLIFRKIETDRLGREFIVKKEKLTWRGKIVE